MYPLSTVHWIQFIVTHLYICFIIVVIAQLDTIVYEYVCKNTILNGYDVSR